MSVIAFIPARCGSKAIPFKNIASFCGEPLIYWNLNALQQSMMVDEIYVATDCSEISDKVEAMGFSKVKIFKRNKENANDTASTEAVMLEFIETQNIHDEDTFMLVQATSPFTQTKHFSDALSAYAENPFDSLLSCVRIKRFFWSDDGKSVNYNYKKRPRRQDFKGELMENGAFYINSVKNIRTEKNRLSGKIGIYEMPEYTATEIDEQDDWIIAENLMKKHLLIHKKEHTEIKLFLSDVDGVLTDAGMYYSENGDELKKFSTYDGKAFELLKNQGIQTGIITSEKRELNRRRAEKLKLDFIFQNEKQKLEKVISLCKKLGIAMENVAYIGDDVNDVELLKVVGLAACPANAVSQVKKIPYIIHLEKKGGEGAVREFTEKYILKKN